MMQLRTQTRYKILLAGFTVTLLAVVFRLAFLHIVKHDFLQSQSDARSVRVVEIPAYRGMLRDRNGEPLAVSTPVSSVWMNPQEINLDSPKVKAVSELLNISLKELATKKAKYQNREFIYLQRHVRPGVAEKIGAIQAEGINILSEYRRYYPEGEVAAQLLGITDIDERGLEGLELAYNDLLAGKPGLKRVVKDRLGRQVEELEHIRPVQPGKDVILSIDQRLQFLAYKYLEEALQKHQAVSGSAVVVDVHTGEVLAMVNAPSFNPNQRNSIDPTLLRNAAVTDAFEPGSVLKTFSMASVLENTTITPASMVDTKPGILRLPGGVVRDIHDNGLLEVSDILKASSNIGISKLVLKMEPGALWATYRRFGFGGSTESGFPGENSGSLVFPSEDESFVLATMSFGYGVAVTPLQLAQAYAIIGTGGIRRPISFVSVADKPLGERVIESHVARQVLEMLSIAVEHDRSNARVASYRVAGKTGTARKLGKDGYQDGKYIAVFGGLAPALDPRVSIVVTINEPRAGQYYSNQVAAPVFSKIAGGALRLLKIAPDLYDTRGVQVVQLGSKK